FSSGRSYRQDSVPRPKQRPDTFREPLSTADKRSPPPPAPTQGSPCGSASAKDSVEWEGRSLLKALVKKSALCGEQVHVLGCEVSEEEFREGFDSSINSRQQALLRPGLGQATSHIFYEPDAYDDLDQEDPDDDLDV
uniref:Elongator complex protein 5 n=1 Tax=Moschus moschiferus TaxID=68415 RepID=A0A8C6DFV0_MOSMO